MKHEEIADYNWDDGLTKIWPVVNNPKTEFATALLIYWRIEGPFFNSNNPRDDEYARMNKVLEKRLNVGFYKKGKLRYDPLSDNQLSKVQIFKLKKQGFPPELIQPNWEG